MIYKSYAKLNIYLKIINRRENYHILNSLFIYLDLCDDIEIIQSKKNSIEIKGNFRNSLDNDYDANIIAKTHKLFNEVFEVSDCFSIILNKNIPIGGGLGGGSSNAAVFLKFLLNYYRINLTFDEKYQLAVKIGADVPFFMQDNACYVGSIGDEIQQKVNFKPFEIILIEPNIKSDTANIFKKYQLIENNFSQALTNLDFHLSKNKLLDLSKNFGNDLYQAFQNEYPKLVDFYKNENLFLSGSGSTFFAYDLPIELEKKLTKIAKIRKVKALSRIN